MDFSIVAWVALAGVVVGCSGSITASSAGNDAGAGASTGIDASSSASKQACDQYFAAKYLRCGGPRRPAAEIARLRTRFEQVCADEIALPGSGVDLAGLTACASALDLASCQLPAGPPAACAFGGSLPGGAACMDGIQCASGRCQGMQSLTPGGPIGPTTCGTCAPVVAVGQVCGSAGCPQGAACITDNTSAPSPVYRCVAVTEGDPGASCDDLTALCKPGLYCAAGTARCTKLGTAGSSCDEGPGKDWPGGCAAPLGCVDLPSGQVCGSGSEGGVCIRDQDCAPGLGCVPGACSSSCPAPGKCASVKWVAAGQACDGHRTRCLVGHCSADTSSPAPDGGFPEGVCPTVIRDGQPCGVDASQNSTCDTFAECFQSADGGGRCTLLDSVACK